MRFAFSDEQQMFRDAVRAAFAREVSAAHVRQWAEQSQLDRFDAIAAAQGWLGLGLPEAQGGQGGGLVELALFFEEAGRVVAPSGQLLSMAALALPLLQQTLGGPGPLAAALDSGVGVAVVLPAGLPPDEGGTLVRAEGNRLEGRVPLVLDAPAAQQLLVPLREGDVWQLWHMPAQAAGVQVEPRRLIDHTRRYGDVLLQGAVALRLGSLDQAAMARVAAGAALMVAAESLGLARRLLEMTVGHVQQRVQFGVPVGSFQAVKHAAAEVLVDIEAAHSGVYHAAWALDHGADDAVLHAWCAKSFASEAAVRTADRALFLHGAIGYTWEYELHYFYKRAKSNLELFGAPKRYRERIADALQLAGNAD